MARHTTETLLISALINASTPLAHKGYGIVSEHFFGYRSEFDWLTSFAERHDRCPTKGEFKAQFHDFPHDDEQVDLRYPSEEIIRTYSARKLSGALLKASTDLKAGHVEDAFAHFKNLELRTVVAKPTSLLMDESFMDDYEQPGEKRVSMPWPTLQGATNGIGPGELWYLAARPGQGKSASMLAIAAHAVMAGERVVFYSLEMSKRQVQIRMHSILARMLGFDSDARAMKSRSYDALEYRKLIKAIGENVPGDLHVHTPVDGPVSPAVVAAMADDYDLSIVDYVGLMRADNGGRAVDDWRVIATMSNDLKTTALSKNTRILVASQINREGDSGSKPPKLKHLSQSDALGQDGDAVITLTRYGRGASAYSLEKNRDGESGVAWWTRFSPNTGDYREVTRDTADEIVDAAEDEAA